MNPALLAPARKQLGFGLRASRFVLELEQDGAARAVFGRGRAKGFFLGAMTPLSDGDIESAFGLFAGSPPDFIVRARLPFAEEPDFPLLVGRASAFDFAAGLGLRHDFSSLGIGAASARRAFRDDGRRTSATDCPSQVVNNELMPAVAPVFGLGIEPGGDFSVGASLAHRAARELRRDARDGRGLRRHPAAPDARAGRRSLRAISRGRRGVAAFRANHPARRASRTNAGRTTRPRSARPSSVRTTYRAAALERAAGSGRERRLSCRDSPRATSFRSQKIRAVVRAGYAFVPAALPEQRGGCRTTSIRRATGLPPATRSGFRRTGLPLHLDAAFRFDLLASAHPP